MVGVPFVLIVPLVRTPARSACPAAHPVHPGGKLLWPSIRSLVPDTTTLPFEVTADSTSTHGGTSLPRRARSREAMILPFAASFSPREVTRSRPADIRRTVWVYLRLLSLALLESG